MTGHSQTHNSFLSFDVCSLLRTIGILSVSLFTLAVGYATPLVLDGFVCRALTAIPLPGQPGVTIAYPVGLFALTELFWAAIIVAIAIATFRKHKQWGWERWGAAFAVVGATVSNLHFGFADAWHMLFEFFGR